MPACWVLHYYWDLLLSLGRLTASLDLFPFLINLFFFNFAWPLHAFRAHTVLSQGIRLDFAIACCVNSWDLAVARGSTQKEGPASVNRSFAESTCSWSRTSQNCSNSQPLLSKALYRVRTRRSQFFTCYYFLLFVPEQELEQAQVCAIKQVDGSWDLRVLILNLTVSPLGRNEHPWMSASFEGHWVASVKCIWFVSDQFLVWVCPLPPLGPVKRPEVWLAQRSSGALGQIRGLLRGFAEVQLPFLWFILQANPGIVAVFPKIQSALEYLTSVWMLGAKYPQILDPLRKGSGAFRTRFSKLSLAGTSRWELPKSLGSAEILGLGSSARHHVLWCAWGKGCPWFPDGCCFLSSSALLQRLRFLERRILSRYYRLASS